MNQKEYLACDLSFIVKGDGGLKLKVTGCHVRSCVIVNGTNRR